MAKKKRSPLPVLLVSVLLAGLSALAVFVSIPRIPTATESEPLADAASLMALASGLEIPQPDEKPYAAFHGQTAFAPTLASLTTPTKILGITNDTGAERRIEVDLTNQRVYAYEGSTKVHEFVVSTGKWGRTPTGEFTIWTKVKSQLMKGGSKEKGTYYYLPNVPWVMFFYNKDIAKMRGFSFHGTYWHDKFGTPQSHGCINMRTEEAKILYDWATPVVTNPKAWSTPSTSENPGTKVIIYGTAPTS